MVWCGCYCALCCYIDLSRPGQAVQDRGREACCLLCGCSSLSCVEAELRRPTTLTSVVRPSISCDHSISCNICDKVQPQHLLIQSWPFPYQILEAGPQPNPQNHLSLCSEQLVLYSGSVEAGQSCWLAWSCVQWPCHAAEWWWFVPRAATIGDHAYTRSVWPVETIGNSWNISNCEA